MKTLGRKILSIALITIMLVAHISSVGIHIGEVIAADMALNSQNSKTNHDNVEFDTFFVENEKGTHDAIKEVKGDNKILAKISVKNVGYLKDARIDFAGSNFEISSNVESDKVIKVENNSITLNQINANEDISIALPFEFKYEEKLNFNKLNAVSEAKLSATYIDGNGKEKPIKKDIKLGLKWTAQSEVEVTTTISKYIPYDVSGEKGLIVQMLLSEEVKENKLPIKESNIEIQTPEINGLKPIEAIVNSLEANMQSSYDEKTGKLLIRVNNEANGQNEITWKKDAKRNYEITYKYSEAAVEEEIKIVKDLKVNTILYSYDEKNIITE